MILKLALEARKATQNRVKDETLEREKTDQVKKKPWKFWKEQHCQKELSAVMKCPPPVLFRTAVSVVKCSWYIIQEMNFYFNQFKFKSFNLKLNSGGREKVKEHRGVKSDWGYRLIREQYNTGTNPVSSETCWIRKHMSEAAY